MVEGIAGIPTRRHSRPSDPSPYLRTLEGLEPEALDPGYLDYVEQRFEQIIQNEEPEYRASQKARPRDQNPALLRDR